MCGIVGIIAKSPGGLFQKDTEIFEQIIWADQIRGQDGTGMFFNTNTGASSLKVVGTPGTLFFHKQYKKTMERAVKEADFLIGHNRAATKGKIALENTHPFAIEHIIGVHNGTLLEHKSLADVESDSRAIFTHMAKEGARNTIKNIDGAFALAWYDCNEQSINLSRNFERPLSIMETATTWIISSEPGLGKWIAERNYLTVNRVVELSPRKIYKISMDEKSKLEEEDVELLTKTYHYSPPKTTDFRSATETDKPETHQHTAPSGTIKHYHAFGTTLRFVPSSRRKGYGKENSLFFDDKKRQHFLHGDVVGEPGAFVKVYGSMEFLNELEKSDLLSGNVLSTHINGTKRVTYTLGSATAVVISKETSLITPPAGTWGQGSKVECAFCLEITDKSDAHLCNTGAQSEWLCPECWVRFYSAVGSMQ